VDSTVQILTILILLLAMVVSVVMTQFVRRRRNLFPLRIIPAYQALPLAVGEGIESNRPVHVSFGGAGLGGAQTLLTLASAELFYQTAERAAIGGIAPILTVSDPTAIPLGQDTLRRAYQSRDLLERYHRGSVRWYPAGARSLAFAAALTATIGDDRVSANILVGSFGPELALVAEASARRNRPVIAASDQLEGQAVAYVLADQPLIGEEIFTAGAYLDESPSHIAGVVTQDVLRILLIIAILIPTALAVGDAILQGRFTAAIGRLLGGG
jgi:hypothetical protein